MMASFERVKRKASDGPVPGRTRGLGRSYGRQKVLPPAQEGLAFSPKPAAPLPAETPAWTDHGQTVIGPASLWMPLPDWETMLRHEDVHRLQQSAAPYVETSAARAQAERQAGGSLALQPIGGVPAVLGFPVQQHQPWNKVWIGYSGLVGEVIEGGICVRIFLTWDELGIKNAGDYHCDRNRAPKKIDSVVARMKTAAQAAVTMNQYLPEKAIAQRTSLIAIMGKGSSSRTWRGKGVILLNQGDFFSASMEDTITHESSHGIIEQHSTAKGKPKERKPDVFALRIASLFSRLEETQPVPIPTDRFDKKKPPVKGGKDTHMSSSGWVMVMDMLWSGSGGHPWDGVDEFFASAFAGYLRQPKLLKQSMDFYGKLDPKIPPLAEELLKLLEARKLGALKDIAAPADPKDAADALRRVTATPSLEDQASGLPEGWLDIIIDPTKMPEPALMECKDPKKKTEPEPPGPTGSELDDVLDFDKPAQKNRPAGRK